MKTIGELLEQKLRPVEVLEFNTPDIKELAQFKPLTNCIGVEVELENFSNELFERSFRVEWTNTRFRFERDGSLRNGGMEIITNRGTTVYDALRNLYILLTTNEKQGLGWTVSKRCSIHVHWNVLDRTSEQIKQIILLYSILERSLYKISGNRYDNIFCVPLLRNFTTELCHFLVDPDKQVVFKDALNRVYLTIPRWGKYSGLNILPIGAQGTVEFRHHEGTLDFNVISSWILTLNNFINFASGFESVTALIKYLEKCWHSHNYKDLKELFVIIERNGDITQNPVDVIQDLDFSLSKVLTLLISINGVGDEDFIPEVNKPVKKRAHKTKQPRAPRLDEGFIQPPVEPLRFEALNAEEVNLRVNEINRQRERLLNRLVEEQAQAPLADQLNFVRRRG